MNVLEAVVVVLALIVVMYGLFPNWNLLAGPTLDSERIIVMAIALLALLLVYLLVLTLLDSTVGSAR
jgi:hypothetical protein